MKPSVAIIPIVLLWACAQKAVATKPVSQGTQPQLSSSPVATDTILAYNSAANGTANLTLTMLSNHTFNFHIQTIPPTDPKAIDENLGGIWKDVNEHKRLVFRDNKPIVKELFDSLGAQNKQFIIINDTVVDINDKLSGIFIGGILCEKRKQRP
ncbi:MAG TPA: hypothetical protein VL947_10805 [Cytophagales bacterium]|nr:hypothetical protein [Cytophagales bacterium]